MEIVSGKMHTFTDQWVSVKDRLPDTHVVLVYDGLEMFEARFFSGVGSLPYFYSQDTGHLPDVTHWMPLPDKPLPRPPASRQPETRDSLRR